MPICPDCGSIIMEGDPYCSHCGAILSWSDDSQSQRDYHDSFDEAEEYEKRLEELINKICEHYKVKFEYVDVADTYTEYVFFRKTPYYTLKIVATDKYGNTLGIKREDTRVDFTKLLENEEFKKLVENMDYGLTVNLHKDEIAVKTENAFYILDTESMRLVEKYQNPTADKNEKYCPKCNRTYHDREFKYCPVCRSELKIR